MQVKKQVLTFLKKMLEIFVTGYYNRCIETS